MATYYSDYETAVRAAANGSLHTRAKEKQVTQKAKVARFSYVPTAGELATESIVLGSLNCPKAKVIPEQFRIRFNVVTSAAFSVLVQLIARFGTNQYQAATWARSTTTATVTTPLPHNLVTGQIITVSVTSDAAAIVLGTVTVTVTGLYTYTFTCLNAGAASGTVTIGPAAGQFVPLTSSVAFTQAAIYTGVASSVGDLIELDKTAKLELLLGTVTTAFPVTRKLLFEVAYFDEN